MREPSYELRDNATKVERGWWQAGQSALTKAFGKFETLIPYVLGLNQAQMTTFADKKSPEAYGGGYYGTLISRKLTDPADVLIWYKGLVHVQPIG